MCEGPLILGVDDSDPPQCDDPVSGLPQVMPFIALAGLIVSASTTGIVRFLQR